MYPPGVHGLQKGRPYFRNQTTQDGHNAGDSDKEEGGEMNLQEGELALLWRHAPELEPKVKVKVLPRRGTRQELGQDKVGRGRNQGIWWGRGH
jgi:hypothetical protein